MSARVFRLDGGGVLVLPEDVPYRVVTRLFEQGATVERQLIELSELGNAVASAAMEVKKERQIERDFMQRGASK